MSISFKAAVLENINSNLKIKDLKFPKLKTGQVLVKVLFSGVCRSQLMEIEGKRGEDKWLPHCLGHEGSGIVIDIGNRVTKVKKNDEVILTWIKGTRTYVDAYWELERDVRERDATAARLAVSAYAAAAGEELRRAVASLPPVAALGPPWDGAVLARGDAVRIDGLGAQRRFNGKKGRVLGELGEGAAHRVKVALPDGQSLAVRRSNLAKVADAAPADKKRD